MVRKVILEPAFEVVPQASVIKRRLNVLSNGKQTRKRYTINCSNHVIPQDGSPTQETFP